MNNKYLSNIIFLRFAAITFISISVFYFSYTSVNKIFGLVSDNAVYLLQAELYSPWHIDVGPAAEYIRQCKPSLKLVPCEFRVLRHKMLIRRTTDEEITLLRNTDRHVKVLNEAFLILKKN